MVRTHVMHQEFIKRSGIIAASFLIATLAMVIINTSSASALLGAKLPLGKNLAPITDRVNGLVNKGLGLPIKIDSTDKLKVNALDVVDAEVKIPVVPVVTESITEPLDSTVKGLSNTLEPVTDKTAPATRSTLGRVLVLGKSNGRTTHPHATTAHIRAGSDASVAGASARTSSTRPNNTESSTSQQPTLLGSAISFFASTLPAALQDIARNIAGKEVGVLPTVVSLLLFLMTLGAVGGIVYASNHGGVVALGRYKFTLFVNGNDLTEMATFVTVAVCFGVIAIFLALTSL